MQKVTTGAAVAAAVLLVGCGGDDPSPEPAGTPVASPAASPEAAPETTTESAAPMADDADETSPQAGAAAQDGSGATGSAATGEDGVPALADIWGEVHRAADEAESVTLEVDGGSQMAMRLASGQLDDSNYRLVVEPSGQRSEVIVADGGQYAKQTNATWELAGLRSERDLSDQWVSIGTGNGALMTMSEAFGAMLADQPQPGDTVNLQTSSAELTELDGEAVYHYVVAGAQDVELWVSADGEYRLLGFDRGVGTPDGFSARTSEWDAVERIPVPEGAITPEEARGR